MTGVRLTLLLLIIIQAGSHALVWNRPRPRVEQEMRLVVPPLLQLILAGGDRYLAANVATFRAVTVGVFELQPETYHVLALTQRSAAILNPMHEDNYYSAAAILPWNGQYELGQEVLARATQARTQDALPPFFHAFNRFHFKQDYVGAADDLRVAAARSEEVNRRALTSIAAKWMEKSDDPAYALNVVQGMMNSTRDPALKHALSLRVRRLEGLVELDHACKRYLAKFGHAPLHLSDLQLSGLLTVLPVDPMGVGYELDSGGHPKLRSVTQVTQGER